MSHLHRKRLFILFFVLAAAAVSCTKDKTKDSDAPTRNQGRKKSPKAAEKFDPGSLLGVWQAKTQKDNCLIAYDFWSSVRLKIEISCLDGHYILTEKHLTSYSVDGKGRIEIEPVSNSCNKISKASVSNYRFVDNTRRRLRLGTVDLKRVDNLAAPDPMQSLAKGRKVKQLVGCFDGGNLRKFKAEGDL